MAALVFPCLLPMIYRLSVAGLGSYPGLLSDFATGTLLLSILLLVRFRLLRALFLFCWFILQIGAIELNAAVGRLPVVQDAVYLTDPVFVSGSMSGFHLAAPVYTILLAASVLLALIFPLRSWHLRTTASAIVIAVAGLLLHSAIRTHVQGSSVSSMYNAAHWLVVDAFHQHELKKHPAKVSAQLMESLKWNGTEGTRLLPQQKPSNVLLVTLEGIPGIALASIREQMNLSGEFDDLSLFDQALQGAMLVPTLTVHSHQTIRGLYAIHCGDFSKFTFDMPKAYELLMDKQRGEMCLPAQLAADGWSTHYLQGAPLEFMNKDKVMPVIGFQEVHGVEWFKNRTVTDFIWGAIDADFFSGAKQYITELRQHDKPWFLSLLTVGTHQPFYASEKLVNKYGSRRKASMAELDLAVTDFLGWLKNEGVLDDTLVIFTSDESHGSSFAEWTASWGYAAVFSPDRRELPRYKQGEYGALDFEASILDYFGLTIPDQVKGRSLFRNYDTGRQMFSYTSSRLRWHNPAYGLLECSGPDNCRFFPDTAMIGLRPEPATESPMDPHEMYATAALLDHSISPLGGNRILDFSNKEVRNLPETITNEWTENLVGAQYLDFPAGSRVQVDITLQASGGSDTEARLRLVLRQFEKDVPDIKVPEIPVLHNGEETSINFNFDNPKKRQAFTFHLVGEGKNTKLLVKNFKVTIMENN